MMITQNRPPQVDWDKQRRKKRRRRLDTVDAGLVLVAAVLLGVGSHLFTDSLFRSRSDTVTTVVPETLPSTTLATTGVPGDLALSSGIDGSVTDHRTLTVTGTAVAGADVHIGGLRTSARSDGSWAIAVLLQPGVNDLTVESSVGDALPPRRRSPSPTSRRPPRARPSPRRLAPLAPRPSRQLPRPQCRRRPAPRTPRG